MPEIDVVTTLKKLADAHEKQLFLIRQRVRDIEIIPRARALVGKYFKSSTSGFGYYHYTTGVVYQKIIAFTGHSVILDSIYIEPKFKKIEFCYRTTISAIEIIHSKFSVEITQYEYNKMSTKACMTVKKLANRGK